MSESVSTNCISNNLLSSRESVSSVIEVSLVIGLEKLCCNVALLRLL